MNGLAPTHLPPRCLWEEVCEWPFLETTSGGDAAAAVVPSGGGGGSPPPAVTPPSDYAGLLKDGESEECGV